MDVCFLVVFILAYCLLLFQMADNTVRVLLILYSVKLKHDVDWVHIYIETVQVYMEVVHIKVTCKLLLLIELLIVHFTHPPHGFEHPH